MKVASRRRSSPAPLPVDADIVTNRTRRRTGISYPVVRPPTRAGTWWRRASTRPMTGSPVQRGGKNSAGVGAYVFRCSLVAVLLPPVLGVHALLTRGAVMPGTAVAGVDLGGLSRTDARARIVHDIGDRAVGARHRPRRRHDGRRRAVRPRHPPRRHGHGRPRVRGRPRPGAAAAVPHVREHRAGAGVPEEADAAEGARRAGAEATEREAGRPGRRHRRRRCPRRTASSTTTPRRCAPWRSPPSAGTARSRCRPAVTKPAIPTEAAETTAADAKRLLAKSISLRYHGKTIGKITPKELAPLAQGEARRHRLRAQHRADRPAQRARRRREGRLPRGRSTRTGRPTARRRGS